MRPYQRFLHQCAVAFLVPPLLFHGCSLIGFGVGAISDAGKKEGESVSGVAELRTLARGTSVTLITQSGSKVEGDFLGMEELNRRDYDRLYLAAMETLGVGGSLPRPGDSISFNHYDKPGGRVRGLFRGVDPGTVVLWQATSRYSFGGMRGLEGDSARQLDLPALRAFADEGRLPYVTTGVRIQRGNETVSVPVEDIAWIERSSGGSGKLTGFMVGAAVDVAVLIVAASTAESCNHEHHEFARAQGCNVQKQ